MYSFQTDLSECPGCRRNLVEEDSIKVDGQLAYVIEGFIFDSHHNNLVLLDPLPYVTCTLCEEEIAIDPFRED